MIEDSALTRLIRRFEKNREKKIFWGLGADSTWRDGFRFFLVAFPPASATAVRT
jgi:hypothetical protein